MLNLMSILSGVGGLLDRGTKSFSPEDARQSLFDLFLTEGQ